jgi:hypothetical protein
MAAVNEHQNVCPSKSFIVDFMQPEFSPLILFFFFFKFHSFDVAVSFGFLIDILSFVIIPVVYLSSHPPPPPSNPFPARIDSYP